MIGSQTVIQYLISPLSADITFGSLVVERWTRDLEVAGSSLTHCTAEHIPGQAAHVHVSPSSMTWY